jgi:rhamnosyltransferase subunit B
MDIEHYRKELFAMVDDIAEGGVAFFAGFSEMLCMWFDDFWHSHGLVEDGIITQSEFEILNRFNGVFRGAYPKGSPVVEQDLRKLQTDPIWLSVVLAAKEAQSALAVLREEWLTTVPNDPMNKSAGMRIIISTFGSFGDIHPYVAIALELRARGHTPVIATSEVYREKMEALGIEFHPVRPAIPSYDQPDEIHKLIEEVMEASDGSQKVMNLLLPYLREIYDDLNAAAEGADLILTHPLPLVGPIVAQMRKLPWVSSVLAPLSLFSTYDPPVLPQMPGLYHILKLHPAIARGFFRLALSKLEKMMAPVYDLRAQLGLPRGEQPLMAGQHSPSCVLALFSKVMAAPQPDWPGHTVVTGFPFYDGRDFFGETETPRGLIEFLDDGEPPIIFTLGSSAFWVARDFYRDSIEAAMALGRRALLLIGHSRNLPAQPLPAGVAAFEYAPYSEVLPRASAIVHQGGVGTTGQGLRSGKPVLILPHAHDQFDNAARVVRLGCGRGLPRPKYCVKSAITELRALLGDRRYAKRAAEIGEIVRQENGPSAAADAIEQVLGVRQTSVCRQVTTS